MVGGRLVCQNREECPMASGKVQRFEQPDYTALVNDGFNGLKIGRAHV